MQLLADFINDKKMLENSTRTKKMAANGVSVIGKLSMKYCSFWPVQEILKVHIRSIGVRIEGQEGPWHLPPPAPGQPK